MGGAGFDSVRATAPPHLQACTGMLAAPRRIGIVPAYPAALDRKLEPTIFGRRTLQVMQKPPVD
jgi:hypothetical protein